MSEIPQLTPDDDSISESGPYHRHRLWKILGGMGLGLGVIVASGGVVLYVWGARIATNLLLPRVTEAINDSIQRPIELGDVEGFSLWGVRLGKTVIPPTDTDESSVTVDGIEINIGLRSLIFQRTLKPNVVLLSPAVSLVENQPGQWLDLNLSESSEAELPIALEIESIEVRDASLSAEPYKADQSEAVVPREPIQIEAIDGRVGFFGESAQEAKFRLAGDVLAQVGDREAETAAGRFKLTGNANLATQAGKANARIKNLPSMGANLLLPDSLGIRAGELDGNLTIAADFNGGELEQSSLDVTGTAQFRAGELVSRALDVPVQNIQSQLRFRGQRVSIKETSLQLNDAVLLVEGEVGVEEGYDLTAQIPSVTVAAVQTLVNVELPIPAAGAFTLVTDVTGALERPAVTGRLASIDSVVIDKVSVESMVADFSTTLPDLKLARFNLDEFRAQPTAGGLVVAQGQADLADLETVTFQLEGNAKLPTDAIAQTYGVNKPPGIVLGTLSANFEVAGDLDNQNASANWRLSQGLISASGQAKVSDLQQPEFQLLGRANAPVDVVARAYDVDLPDGIVLGRLSADFAVDGDLDNQEASANWRLSQGLISARGQAKVTDLQQPSFQLSGQANAPVDVVARAYDVALPDDIVLGRLSADFEAGGTFETQTVLADWRLAEGLISARGQATITDLQQPSFQLSGHANVPVDVVAQAYDVALPEDIVLGRLSAAFAADGTPETQTAFADWQLSQGSFSSRGNVSLIDNIVALENAQLIAPEGKATAAATLNVQTQDWQATANTDQIAIEQFTELASGLLSADLIASGNLSSLNLDQIDASGNAVIANAQVQLPDTRAPLFAPGDWTTAFEWQGDRIAVNRFSAPGLQAEGSIGLDVTRDIPIGDLALGVVLESYDLERINGLLPDTVRQYAKLAGFTSFNGQLRGTLDNPQLSGNAQLDNLAVNDLEFETLSGPIDFALAEGGRVDLRGQQDRLQLVAVETPQKAIPFWPLSFKVRHQDFIAGGTTDGDVLRAKVVQLPLERLAIAPAAQYGLGKLSGQLEAEITANLADVSNPTATGTLSVSDPSISPVDAKQLNATFAYADGIATLDRGELFFDQSRYLLRGRANLGAIASGDVAYQGELVIPQGRIEDLIPIAQALDLSLLAFNGGLNAAGQDPTGSAADLALEPRGVPDGSLLSKLESFMAFLNANPEAAAAMAEGQTSPAARSRTEIDLPPLADLEGGFTGEIAFGGNSLDLADARADFNLQGDSWEWGESRPPNQFALRGTVAQSALEIETAFVDAGKTQIKLTADGNLDRLNGQLTVQGLPIALAQLLYPLPMDVEGELALATTLGGSLANPAFTGELAIATPRINDYALAGIETDFNYRNALLAVDAKAIVKQEARPISVKGRIPYALPFIEAAAPTEQLSVTAVIPNGNLEIINALTDEQVQWHSGQGQVTVDVGGTFSQPEVMGKASFRDAVVSSKLLADDVTNLSGDVLFNLEQVAIRQLQAQIKDGRLAVDGQLPLLPAGESIAALLTPSFTLDSLNQSSIQQPNSAALRVALEKLPVKYSNLVSGVFDGQLLVTGAALTPTVTGSLEVDNGLVNATRLVQQAESSGITVVNAEKDGLTEAINAFRADRLNLDPPEQEAPEALFNEILEQVAIRDLQIRLGNRLTIAARPVFRITALGDVSVNGTLADIQPAGTIELQTGEVNLFSSRFRLDRGAPNTAIFKPENGLDPILDVELLARVQDADINTLPPPSGGLSNSEVDAAAFDTTGEVRFLRVRASAQGPASQITDNLTLTSRPSLDQDELLALLSSSAVTGLSNASLTQIGGFLGSGSRLSTFGDRIADAVGLQSFRIFPTTDASDDGAAGIGIGLEASAAIGDRVNITIFDILNNNNLPQLGVLYRFTDELNIRGASNLNDTDLEIEYRLKF